MNVVLDNLGLLADGLLTTVELTALTVVVALPLGLLLVACRVSPVRPLRIVAGAYVELQQNIPLLVWIVLWVFALPEIGLTMPLATTVVVASGLYSAAYYAETVRAGINSVPLGQTEAARALGFGTVRTLASIVLPQAVRAVVQPLGNLTIMVAMNTALAAAAGVVELTATAHRINLAAADPILLFTAAGVGYAALAVLISAITGRLERKLLLQRAGDAPGGGRLFDHPGPKTRRRTRNASVVATAVALAAISAAVVRFAAAGQLDPALWSPFGTWPIWRYLLDGLGSTALAAVLSIALGAAGGLVVALARLSRFAVLRAIGRAYVEVIRVVPALLLVYVTLFALPGYGLDLPLLWKLVVPLAVSSAAGFAEVFRAGITGIDTGQREAAAAVGLRPAQVMRHVLLPQAVRRAAPALVSQCVGLLKDTSLGYVVNYGELLASGKVLATFTHALLPTYLVVALVYLVINGTLSQLVRTLETRGRMLAGSAVAHQATR
ncbi:amino acid ABC transporter permease [Amycolatopsis sp. CA-230715]|uniref:amino acid ABC transporter permease n=1 Tax=Amycolatopsis sp. CA-230715 TaxID=2745196 RepID=UPI001C320C61|nr:amino acid ABC transporter permease [Amycolatopsis sp. CA-230715]QWF78643.1 hypothetical protein HUW46_02041 [Amycolatopsis sp. CA-230715]